MEEIKEEIVESDSDTDEEVESILDKLVGKYDEIIKECPIATMTGLTFPNTCCAFGKKYSGKSTFLKQYLVQYNREFDEIILISNSAKSTGEYDHIFDGQKHKMKIVDQITDDDLEYFIDKRKNDGAKAKPSLIMFDDIIGMKNFRMNSDVFKELVTSGRHYNISLLLASQKFRIIPDFLRSNCEFALFLNINKNEIAKVFEEFGPKVKKGPFVEKYQEIVKHIGYGLMHRLSDQEWFLTHIAEYIGK